MINPQKLHHARTVTVASILIGTLSVNAQSSITGISTDFGGYFHAESTDPTTPGANTTNRVNSQVQPNDSHNLLSFTVLGSSSITGGNYSTGVNNATLTANSESFLTANFAALAPSVFEAGDAGQGSNADGTTTGFTTKEHLTPGGSSEFDVSSYLNDGINGLDISTFANNAGGTFSFDLTGIDVSEHGDGVPDFLYFNNAVPSSTANVTFAFFDGNTLLGSASAVEDTGINIATIRNDRFSITGAGLTDATQNASNSRQDIQGFAFEISDVVATQSIFGSATRLELTLPNAADPPFIAYNTDAFTATDPTPPIPEPTTFLTISLGAVSLLLYRRRK